MNVREAALRALRRIEEGDPAPVAIARYAADSAAEPLLRTLVLATLRWRGTADHVIETIAARPISKIDRDVVPLLRLGIVQLFWTSIAPHAAVDETVKLARGRLSRARGFVNAILRRAADRDLDDLLPGGRDAGSLAIRYSHPRWLVERWLERFGPDRAIAILAANQELSYPDLLIDTGVITTDDAIALVESRGGSAKRGALFDDVIRLDGSTSIVADEIARGWFHPMDEGSVAVARTLVRRGRVLDLAAAPGGKSVALRLAGHDVVAHDRSLARLVTMRRLVRPHAAIPLVTGDGTAAPFRDGTFDVVLLDAPCSATGTIRKNPEVKWRLTPDDPLRHAELQKSMLKEALRLAPVVHYATCSLEGEENDGVVETSVAEGWGSSDRFEDLPDSLLQRQSDGVIDLTPDGGTDGFSIRIVRRNG